MARVSKYAGQEKHSLWLKAWAEDDLAFHLSLWGGERAYVEENTTVLRTLDRSDDDPATVYQDDDPEGKHYDPPLYYAQGEGAWDPEDGCPVFVPEVPAEFRR